MRWFVCAMLGACAVDPSGLPTEDGGADLDASRDDCPDDPTKTDPGGCGCGVADVDNDGDGTFNCNDDCPEDPAKTAVGVCGCGVPDVDGDGDGAFACDDCDDGDPTRFPGAEDGCTGVDDDCDGTVDEDCGGGCADGTREGFLDTAMYPDIAACDSAWSVPGALGDDIPSCGREAGNDGLRPDGMGCDIDDSCADGWHVCSSVAEVELLTASCEPAYAGQPEVFYAAAVSGTDSLKCADTGTDNVFGCGSVGATPGGDCGVLNRMFVSPCRRSGFDCTGDSTTGLSEASWVTKGEGPGGALCCRNRT